MRTTAILLTMLATSAAAAEPPQWRATPSAGVQTYRYEAREIQDASTKGYQTDFRLKTDGKGGAIADILRSATLDGVTLTPVAIDPVCAKSLGARPGVLATVRLFPLSEEQAKLGAAFLPACAPSGVFLPLTDILNVVLIQSADRFHVSGLKKVGQSSDFAGFSTSLNRNGLSMSEAAAAGKTSLTSLADGQATLEWAPDTARIELVEPNGGQPVTQVGTEHFAFRLVIDARSGQLERGDTIYDDLDLAVSLPNIPADKFSRLGIKRVVSISRLAN